MINGVIAIYVSSWGSESHSLQHSSVISRINGAVRKNGLRDAIESAVLITCMRMINALSASRNTKLRKG